MQPMTFTCFWFILFCMIFIQFPFQQDAFVAGESLAIESNKCKPEQRRFHQPKKPDILCQRVLGKLYNRSILHSTGENDDKKLVDFSEKAETLLNIAASSCDPNLERCVSQVLSYGCGVQYIVCLDFGIDEPYHLTKPCKSFCSSTQQCIKEYPLISQHVSSIISEGDLSAITTERCYDDSMSSNTDTHHTYCRFNSREKLDKLLDIRPLYSRWGINSRCCGDWSSSANLSDDKCCHADNFVRVKGAKQCVMKCPNTSLYSKTDQLLAFNWVLVCASICAISSAITVLTYFADVSRFAYPEKPIIFHSLCCFFFACGHFFRLVTGVQGVACTESRNGRVYLQEGLNGEFMCTVSFLIIYYSQMALHVWWVVLAISWFLTAVKGWSQEALEAISIWFHVSAWAIPTVQTVITLATKRFEGDPLTGLCVIGSQTPINLLFFIIIPISICALLGLLLMTYGFVSVFQVRKRLRTTKIDANLSGVDTKRFDKLMMRMTVFTISYIVPTVTYLALTAYEFTEIPKWYQTLNSNPSNPYKQPSQTDQIHMPKVHFSLIRIFTPFVLCIGTCFWILNCKTLKQWSKLLFSCCHSSYDYNKSVTNNSYPHSSQPNLLAPAFAFRYHTGSEMNSPALLQPKTTKAGTNATAMTTYVNGSNRAPAVPAATRYDMGKV